MFAVLAIASCGSKTSEIQNASGAGNAGSAGTSTTTLCAAGDTRSCVGPGACSGGQACGTDGKWSACDCGAPSGGQSSGGGSSAAGSAGVMSGGVSGQGAGEAGGVGGALASGGGPGDMAGAGGLSAGDEPCPSGPITADCSGQCAATGAGCDGVCPTTVTVTSITSISTSLVVARTPSHPGAMCAYPSGIAYILTVVFLPASTLPWRVSVPAPWYASSDPYLTSRTYAPTTSTACAGFAIFGNDTDFRKLVQVYTLDPDAPAVNIVAEPGNCP